MAVKKNSWTNLILNKNDNKDRMTSNRSVEEDEFDLNTNPVENEDQVSEEKSEPVRKDDSEGTIVPKTIVPQEEAEPTQVIRNIPLQLNPDKSNPRSQMLHKTDKEPIQRKSSERMVLIGIVLDGTPSFTTIYPKVYYVLEQFLTHLKKIKPDYKNVTIKYAVTVLHNDAEPIMFDNGDFFTESENEVITALTNMEFYGGSIEGPENLREAINEQLFVLNNIPNAEDIQNIARGLLMFTDSLPSDGDMTPDFMSNEPGEYGDYINYGLRFADFYAFSDEFMPMMRIVDRNGKLTENGKNIGSYHDIHALLDKKPEALAEYIEKMVRTHISQVSMQV